MQALILVLVGVTSGAMSGLFGVGGGLVLVPLLIYGLSLGQLEAQGLSLAVITLPVMLPAAWQYYRNGQIDLRMAAWIGGGFLVGSLMGGWGVRLLPVDVLRKAFGALMILAGAKMLF